MPSKIALRLAVLALGAAFTSAPALAQYGPPQSPGVGPNGDARYGLQNEAPGGVYNEAPGIGAPRRCRLVITHRRGPNGSVTVRRRICG
jgi:hypothetical protein